MKRKRRAHKPEFKAKVALTALQGDLTMAELVKKFDVHPNQISDWKKQLLGGAPDVFGGGVTKGAMGIAALYPKRNLSLANQAHKVYPYLLRNLLIDRPNQVWATDITYIPMARGFVYLVAVMDWYSRRVLSWRVSNTLDTSFCTEALEEAIERYGAPDIFNTDQGCQFTSEDFTGVLKEHEIKISMDGKGRWVDNVFVERLWRSVKYEEVYLKAYDNVRSAKASLGSYFEFYNSERRHQSLDRQTPDQVYYDNATRMAA